MPLTGVWTIFLLSYYYYGLVNASSNPFPVSTTFHFPTPTNARRSPEPQSPSASPSPSPPPVCTTTIRSIGFPRGCTDPPPPPTSCTATIDGVFFPRGCTPVCTTEVEPGFFLPRGCTTAASSSPSPSPPPSSSSSFTPPTCTSTINRIDDVVFLPEGCTIGPSSSSAPPSSSSPPPSSSSSFTPPTCTATINRIDDIVFLPEGCTIGPSSSSSPPSSSPPPSSSSISSSSFTPVTCTTQVRGRFLPEGCTTSVSASSSSPPSSSPPPSSSLPPSSSIPPSSSSLPSSSIPPPSSLPSSSIPPPSSQSSLPPPSSSPSVASSPPPASSPPSSTPSPTISLVVSSVSTTISGSPTIVPITLAVSLPPSPSPSPSPPPPSPIVSSILTTISGSPTIVQITITPTPSPSPSASSASGGGGGGGGGGTSSSSSEPHNPTQAFFANLQKSVSPIIAYTTGGITAGLVIAGAILGLMGFHALKHHVTARSELGDYAPIGIHEPVMGVGEGGIGEEGHSGNGSGNQDRLVPSFIARLDPITVFLHFQAISTNGLLSLNYPTVYRSFTMNFAWANFIIIPSRSFIAWAESVGRTSDAPVDLATTSNDGTSITGKMTGIEVYATGLKIDPRAISTVVYFVFMGACAIFVLALLLGLAVCQIMIWKQGSGIESHEAKQKWVGRRTRVQQMASSNSLRLINLAIGSLATFGFWQWTQSPNSLIRSILSALAFGLAAVTLTTVTILIVRISYKPGGVLQLFDAESSYAKRWGTLYDTLHERSVGFVVPLSLIVLARSAIVGFGQKSGLVQSGALIFLESAVFLVILLFKPYYSLGYNRLNYLLKACNVVLSLLVLPFANEIGLTGRNADILGIILTAIQSLVALILVVLTILKLGWGYVWYRKKHHAFTKKQYRYQKVSELGH